MSWLGLDPPPKALARDEVSDPALLGRLEAKEVADVGSPNPKGWVAVLEAVVGNCVDATSCVDGACFPNTPCRIGGIEELSA